MIHAIRYLLIVVYTVFWGLPAALLGMLGFSEAVVWIGRRWISWILATCGIRVEASGLENVDPARPAIYMSNHQSVFDIAAIVATIPVSYRFVAKRELTRIPFFGWALAMGGHIVIDRSNHAKSIERLQKAAGRVRNGTHVIFFPEGTRNPEPGLGPFKSGGFYLAIAAGVPVVPVSVSGSRSITPKKSLRVNSGLIRIHYGKPIPTRDLRPDDRNDLKEQVREAIMAGFDTELEPELAPAR